MINQLKELLRISIQVGNMIPMWNQGRGGNLSVKTSDQRLLIKASGGRLASMREEEGWVALSLSEFLDGWSKLSESIGQRSGQDSEQGYAALLATFAKPSLETGFHALLPKSWVIHFHALSSILMAHEMSKDTRRFRSWWQDHSPLTLALIEPMMPGYRLSSRFERPPHADVYLLQNHGLVLHFDGDPGEALKVWDRLENTFIKDFSYPVLGGIKTDPQASGQAIQEGPAPMYFPDFAVFRDRLETVLEVAGNGVGGRTYRLRPGAWVRDRDLCELWWATQILAQACPALEVLPSTITESVADLPTERHRRSLRS